MLPIAAGMFLPLYLALKDTVFPLWMQRPGAVFEFWMSIQSFDSTAANDITAQIEGKEVADLFTVPTHNEDDQGKQIVWQTASSFTLQYVACPPPWGRSPLEGMRNKIKYLWQKFCQQLTGPLDLLPCKELAVMVI